MLANRTAFDTNKHHIHLEFNVMNLKMEFGVVLQRDSAIGCAEARSASLALNHHTNDAPCVARHTLKLDEIEMALLAISGGENA